MVRSICKECECARSKASHEVNGYYDRAEVKLQRNKVSAECKRRLYNSSEEYKNKEKQRCRVREATKDSRGYYTINEWADALAYFGNTCAYCGQLYNITKEHIVPLVRNGSNTTENVIPACLSCNASKSDTDLLTWYPLQTFFSNERLQRIIKYVESKKGSDAKCLI